jgi:hypothetical protein
MRDENLLLGHREEQVSGPDRIKDASVEEGRERHGPDVTKEM